MREIVSGLVVLASFSPAQCTACQAGMPAMAPARVYVSPPGATGYSYQSFQSTQMTTAATWTGVAMVSAAPSTLHQRHIQRRVARLQRRMKRIAAR